MIYVWLGAFIPCIVFPFFRELAYSLWLLCSAQSRCVHPSVPPNVIKVMLDGNFFGGVSSLKKTQLMLCYSANIWVYCFLDHVIVRAIGRSENPGVPVVIRWA